MCPVGCLTIHFLHRKIYWTDGNTINMANMDGSNSKVLYQNQREPVGQYESFGSHNESDLLLHLQAGGCFTCDKTSIGWNC